MGAPTSALAHHILGLPHYKYGDDYPQIPYVEVLAQVESYDLYFTYFPGTPKPGERIRFKLYIVDRETNEPFREPLRVDMLETRAVRADRVIEGPLTIQPGVGPEANDYKFFYAFSDADAYAVRVHFPNGASGEFERIAFPVQIGETDTRPLLGGAVLILGLSITSVAVVKRRRKKRAKSSRRKS
jgi:hypothetical protein